MMKHLTSKGVLPVPLSVLFFFPVSQRGSISFVYPLFDGLRTHHVILLHVPFELSCCVAR